MKLPLLSTIATAIAFSACIGGGSPAVSTTESTAATIPPSEVEVQAARLERDHARRELAAERQRAFEADRDRREREAVVLATWSRLERADQSLDDMRRSAMRAPPAQRRSLEASIDRAEEARAATLEHLRAARIAGADRWPELREALTRSLEAFEQAVDRR
jgi:hypothetical protein